MADVEVTEADLRRADEIVRNRRPFQGAMGTMEKNIARAIAQGIAEGRQQGLEMARKGQSDA